MESNQLLPHLFRAEYGKLVAVLSRLFGFDHIETAEDLASETFLTATEVWSLKGVPENPTSWLYAVAKNKAKNYLKRHMLFEQKIRQELTQAALVRQTAEIDLSEESILDSQLAMMFAVCDPQISMEGQVALALRILCGFSAAEMAAAFLTSEETVLRRVARAREKMRSLAQTDIFTEAKNLDERLDGVLLTLYLLFNEGYYSQSAILLRSELCFEAMRLVRLLTEAPRTAKPRVFALLALMCFHASRFNSRIGENREVIPFDDQERSQWDRALIAEGNMYLVRGASGSELSRYHIEAAIAYWHASSTGTEKWPDILKLYEQLSQVDASPITVMSRLYAMAQVSGPGAALEQALQLKLLDNHLYHALLGYLYSKIDAEKAIASYEEAWGLTENIQIRSHLSDKIQELKVSPEFPQ